MMDPDVIRKHLNSITQLAGEARDSLSRRGSGDIDDMWEQFNRIESDLKAARDELKKYNVEEEIEREIGDQL